MTDPIIRQPPPGTQRLAPDPYWTTLPMVPFVNATADTPGPPQWHYPPGYAGMRDSAASSPRRELSISTTAIDAITPCVYGETEVTGVIGAASNDNALRQLIIGVIFAYGEQDSITRIKVNDEDIEDLSWIAYNSSTDKHVGDGSTELSSKLTSLDDWSAADTETWQNRAHVVFRIDTASGSVPPSITVKATLGGMLITDFRDSSEVASTNPVIVAYHMMTGSMWRKLAGARIHEASWETIADWCDAVMADSSTRWTFSGAVYQRDVDAALMEALSHCFAAPYPDHDGKIRLWAEKAPTALSDTWSASGSVTLEADTASGAALTEVDAGDWLIIGDDVREVASVSDNNTIILALAVTVSAAICYPVESDVHIQRHNWVRLPDAVDVNDYTVPYELRVRYTAAADAIGGQYVEATLGADTGQEEELTLSYCDNASMATRYAETFLALRHYEVFSWQGLVDGIGAGLEPGDLVVFDKDAISPTASNLTRVVARVMPPVQVNVNGTFGLTLRQFDPDSYSTSTAATPGSPGIGDPWDTAPPDEPTDVNQAFIESGNWDGANLVPDEDDLTSGWVDFGSNLTLTPTADGTLIETDDSNPARLIGAGITPGLPVDSVLFTMLAKCSEESANFTVTPTAGGFPSLYFIADGLWHRYIGIYEMTDAPLGTITPEFDLVGADAQVEIANLRAIPYSFRPSLSLIERWTWTEHANAANTVDRYELVRVYPSGYTQLLASAPVGSTYLQATTFSGGAIFGGSSWNQLNGTEIKLRVVGKSGVAVLMDSDTQSVASWTLGDPIKDFKDVDTTAIAAGSLLKVAADGDTHEYLAQGTGGGLDADTLDGAHAAAFVKVDGTAALTADWDAGAHEIRAETFESDVTTGTAPLVVASTTVVTNLNADTVDGYHAADLLASGGVREMTAEDTTEQWALIAEDIEAETDVLFRVVSLSKSDGDDGATSIESLISFAGTAPQVATSVLGSGSDYYTGVQIYKTASSPDIFDIFAHCDSGHFAGFRVEQVESGGTCGSVTLGAWSSSTPSGTLVYDTGDDSVSPAFLRVPFDDPPQWLGSELIALSNFVGSGAGDPTTSNVSDGRARIWKNTTSGDVFLAYNDSGSIVKVQLT